MTWTNHAGLRVKRCRGMTLPQWVTRGLRRATRDRDGYACRVDTFARWRRNERRERKKKRLRRKQRKLDARMMATMREVMGRWTLRGSRRRSYTYNIPDSLRLKTLAPRGPIDWSRFKLPLSLPQHKISSAEPLTYDRFLLDGREWLPEQSSSQRFGPSVLSSIALLLPPVVKRTD